MHPAAPLSTLARSVAQGTPPADLLADLHREVLLAAGATGSVVLQRVTRSGDYVASSGAGPFDVAGLRLRGAEAKAIDALASDAPRSCNLRSIPSLRHVCGFDNAIAIGVAGTRRPACLLVCAASDPTAELLAAINRARIEFGLALELERLAREAVLHEHLRELFLAFSRSLSDLNVTAGLQTLACDANALFGARRTSIWLHERQTRQLLLAAASDGNLDQAPLSTADLAAPASRGLRLDRPRILVSPSEQILVGPLRGWRRALGTLVIEGQFFELDDEQIVEFGNEVARQLSAAIENVQLLQELIRQHRTLADTFDALADLVIVTDNDLRAVQMNQAFELRAGCSRSELIGRPLPDLVGRDLAAWIAGVPAVNGAAGERPEPPSREFDDERLGGVFIATVTPLLTQDGLPVGRVVVARDVTVQIRLEREREALRERLAQSEKLASLGQFVAGIAHEMNNPLQGVLGHLELLIHTAATTRPARAQLKRIYNDADRAARIVRNLLVFAGSRRMARRRVAVDRLLSRVLASRSAHLRRSNVEIVRQQGRDLPHVIGDPLLLQQAFLNIVINAEHAVAERGGSGRIELTTSTDDARTVVRATIRDSGPGMPPDVLPRVFDPFFTTKDVGKGTGLGLAITFGIIQEHGGTILASNAADGGAVFTIELPAVVKWQFRSQPNAR
jgi:PAS domain S-box-containing protein